jgi:aminopeptidase S
VLLTATGAPSGVTASVSTVNTSAGMTMATITIQVSAAATTGSYTIMVTGTGTGVGSVYATFSLTITPGGGSTRT